MAVTRGQASSQPLWEEEPKQTRRSRNNKMRSPRQVRIELHGSKEGDSYGNKTPSQRNLFPRGSGFPNGDTSQALDHESIRARVSGQSLASSSAESPQSPLPGDRVHPVLRTAEDTGSTRAPDDLGTAREPGQGPPPGITRWWGRGACTHFLHS